MGDRNRLRGRAVLAASAIAGLRAWRNYSALPLAWKRPVAAAGHVSIVIPARNEARRLSGLLDSLARLDYADQEIIVVDDDSEDATGDIAARAGVQVIRVSGPEPGWTGKCYACWIGARAGSGDWILFTDADTVHEPKSLDSALAAALQRDAGLVSLLARQHCETFWERLLLPYLYCLYFVGASNVNRPGGNAIANGQYMLFRRSAYERIGGHAVVRSSVVEDVALARLATRQGVRVVLARGESLLSVRMYEDLSSLWEGFGKNAFRFVALSPRTGVPTVLAAMAFGAAVPQALRARSPILSPALLLAPVLCIAGWERRFGVPTWYALLYPLAAAVFQVIACDSIRRSLTRRGTIWKGRRY